MQQEVLVPQVRRGQRVPQVPREMKVLQDLLDHKVPWAIQAQVARQVRKGLLVLQVLQEPKEVLVPKVQQVQQVEQEQQEQQEKLVLLVP